MEEIIKVLSVIWVMLAFWDLVGWKVNKQPLFKYAEARIAFYCFVLPFVIYWLLVMRVLPNTYAGGVF